MIIDAMEWFPVLVLVVLVGVVLYAVVGSVYYERRLRRARALKRKKIAQIKHLVSMARSRGRKIPIKLWRIARRLREKGHIEVSQGSIVGIE